MKLNPILFSSATAALLLAATLAPRESSGQAASDEASIQALVTELAGQQTKIVENQSHIDEKLSVIAEDLRIARIFIGRGGGKTTAP